MWVQMSNFDMAGAGAVPYQCIGGAEHPAAAPYAYAPMLPHWMAFGMASPVPYQYPAAVPHAYGPMCAHSTPFSMAAAVPPPQFSGDTEHPDVPYGSGVVAGTGGAVAARAADRQLDLMHQSHPQYLGVFQCPISGWWGVNIWLQGWQQQIWTYETAERAAEVYDVVALAYHGEDAVINMPLSSYAALLPLLGALDDAIEIILALRRNQQALEVHWRGRLTAADATLPANHPSPMEVAVALALYKIAESNGAAGTRRRRRQWR